MVDLKKQVLAEKENIEKALINLKNVSKVKNKSVVELAAMSVFLHNFYNGIENILKQILKAKNIEITKTDNWHKELLKYSVSSGIISCKLSDKLYEYLAFRHFFVHSYGFMLKESHLENLTANVSEVWNNFIEEIKNVLQF